MTKRTVYPDTYKPLPPNFNWWMLCVTLMFFIVPFQILIVLAALKVEAEWMGIVAVTSIVFGVIMIPIWLYAHFENAVDRSAAKNHPRVTH